MDHVPKRASRSRPAAVVLLLVLVLAQGCANLTAIREFAGISVESAEYTRFVTDYVESPARQKRYQPPSEHEPLDRIAMERHTQQDRLLVRHRLIVEYMDALGQLAADDAVRYDKELDALGRAAKEREFVDAKETDAFAAMVKLLVKGAADHWRQRQLRELIGTANEPFQVIVQSLRIIVERGFGGDLLNEKAAMERYYNSLIAHSSDTAGIAALAEWRDLRLSAIEARAKAIESYGELLRKIARAHQSLYDGRNDLSREGLLREIRGYSKDLRTLLGIKALERG